MTRLIEYTDAYLFVLADYGCPERHRHVAAHFICSMEGKLACRVGGRAFDCEGLFIASNVEHELSYGGPLLLFLFASPSNFTRLMEEKYLGGRPCAELGGAVLEGVRGLYRQRAAALPPQASVPALDSVEARADASLGMSILRLLGIYSDRELELDGRIASALRELEAARSVGPGTAEDLIAAAGLSQSRFSHLFRQQVGISLRGYLAFMKMKKAYGYVAEGLSLTRAALDAGFDSPSHMAATCRRMFGISLSSFEKSQGK